MSCTYSPLKSPLNASSWWYLFNGLFSSLKSKSKIVFFDNSGSSSNCCNLVKSPSQMSKASQNTLWFTSFIFDSYSASRKTLVARSLHSTEQNMTVSREICNVEYILRITNCLKTKCFKNWPWEDFSQGMRLILFDFKQLMHRICREGAPIVFANGVSMAMISPGFSSKYISRKNVLGYKRRILKSPVKPSKTW